MHSSGPNHNVINILIRRSWHRHSPSLGFRPATPTRTPLSLGPRLKPVFSKLKTSSILTRDFKAKLSLTPLTQFSSSKHAALFPAFTLQCETPIPALFPAPASAPARALSPLPIPFQAPAPAPATGPSTNISPLPS